MGQDAIVQISCACVDCKKMWVVKQYWH